MREGRVEFMEEWKEWQEVTLGEVCETNKTTYSIKENWEYVNYLDTGSITQNHIESFQYIKIGIDKLPSRARRKVEIGDIIYSTVRPNQLHYGIILSKVNNMLVSTGFTTISVFNNKANNKFLYYYLTQIDVVEHLQSIGEQSVSTYPSIKPSDIENIKINLPSLPEQKAIAKTLSCLDEKIELNQKMNKTLEEMAQAIFKSWFVDFEPFQDGEFVESELGLIPKGWEVGKLSDLGCVVGGSTPSKKNEKYYTSNGIAWITPKDLSSNKSKFISKGSIDITKLGFQKSSTTMIPKDSILFSSRAPIGYIAIANNEMTTNQGFKSVIPNTDIGTAYIYYYLKININMIEAMSSGSTFKEISGSTMKLVPAIIPDKNAITKFNSLCKYIFQNQKKMEFEIEKLKNTRDTLLPKLMSGEVRVPFGAVE